MNRPPDGCSGCGSPEAAPRCESAGDQAEMARTSSLGAEAEAAPDGSVASQQASGRDLRPISDGSPADWRKRPRKPTEAKRTVRVTLRLTSAEALEIRAEAEAEGVSLADCILGAVRARGRFSHFRQCPVSRLGRLPEEFRPISGQST